LSSVVVTAAVCAVFYIPSGKQFPSVAPHCPTIWSLVMTHAVSIDACSSCWFLAMLIDWQCV